jgi:hypothetical protein
MAWVHVGNVPKFSLTPKLEKLQHFSSMAGVKLLDKTAFVSKQAEVEITLEEFTPENLIIALLSTTTTNTSGDTLYDLFSLDKVERSVKLTGSNDFGAKLEVILPRVFFGVDKVVEFIGDTWGNFVLTGDVLREAGSFGTIQFLGTGGPGEAPQTSPNPINYFIGKGNVYMQAVT